MLVVLIVLGALAFAIVVMLEVQAGDVTPEAFRYYRYQMFAIIGGGVVLALAVLYSVLFVRGERTWWWSLRVVCFVLFAAMCLVGGCFDLDHWNRDNAEGPLDVTATVLSWTYREETEDRVASYTLRVVMPDGAIREWELSKAVGNGMNPRYGDKVDVTYYRLTNIPVAIDLQ